MAGFHRDVPSESLFLPSFVIFFVASDTAMTQEVLDFGFRELETLEDFSLETKGIYDDSEYAKNDEGLYKANKSLRLR